MRTKALIVAAALAAGLATSQAQNVYSLNVVGYINLDLAAGWNLVANQLDTTNNTVGGVLGDQLPNGTQVFKFSSGGWNESAGYVTGVGWLPDGDITINPGEGLFINTPSAVTVTLVGEVMQGALSTPVAAGYSVVSSQVPQAGALETELGYAPQGDDQMYFWSATGQTYATSAGYVTGIGWLPAEPSVAVGEAFFINSTAGTSWDRNFTVE